jgi:molybdate transport system substrate-binding protein
MRWFSILAVVLFCVGIHTAARADVVVFAPGAMSDVLEEIAAAAAKGGMPFKLVVGHSPAQARQIVDGAPADIYISADSQWMDFLSTRHMLAEESVVSLASTRLVLIARTDSQLRFSGQTGESLAALLGDGRLAIADPEMVPAGRFAKIALEKQGSWPGLASRLALMPHVRAVVAMVERGEVPAGIGFQSDLGNDPKIRVVADFSSAWVPPIQFPLVVISGHERDEVSRVVGFLRSQQCLVLLHAHGFNDPSD